MANYGDIWTVIVTWSLAGTITDAGWQDRWRNLFDNYLHGLGGWVVSAHPNTGQTSYRSLRYDYTDAVDSSSQAFYYWWGNSSILYEDATYTTSPGDTGTDGTNAISMFTATTSNWKVWTSSENSGSLLVTHGKRLFFQWLAPQSIFQPIKAAWPAGSNDNPNFHLFPKMNSTEGQYATNWNYAGDNSTEQLMVPNPAMGTQYPYMQPGFDLYYQEFFLSADVYSNFPFTRYSDADVLIHVPGNGPGSAGNNGCFSDPGATVFDGTNYWYRTESDISHTAYMFDFGTSEPDFT